MADINVSERVEDISTLMENVMFDRTVPKNVRRAIENGKNRIADQTEDLSVSLATTIYELDEIANDINIPMHARTELWNIISELERLKEEVK